MPVSVLALVQTSVKPRPRKLSTTNVAYPHSRRSGPHPNSGVLMPLQPWARMTAGNGPAPDGNLSSPEITTGAGPFPAVILAHGCSGIRTPELGWGPLLREWGYATFVVDSFRGRGFTDVCTNARTLTGIQRIPDAYGALRFIATHPRIDTRRVVLMGF